MRTFGTALALAVSASLALAGEAGPVTVIDGDTIEVGGRSVELWGIDAPEMGQLCRYGDTESDCGVLARAALLDLVAGARVDCQRVAYVVEGEGAVYVTCRADGYDLAEGMAYTGWALADQTRTDRYLRWQRDAEAKRRGLWRFEFVPPEAWRAGTRLGPAGTRR